jgi:hypothetical protein
MDDGAAIFKSVVAALGVDLIVGEGVVDFLVAEVPPFFFWRHDYFLVIFCPVFAPVDYFDQQLDHF